MRPRHRNLPRLWLLTDARNDAALDAAIARLPRGSGVIFRHYHLKPGDRRPRFAAVRRLCRRHGHMLVLSANARTARKWGADGLYGPPHCCVPASLVYLATAHDLREIAQARRTGADAILLSPVFATRSHANARPLGRRRFALFAQKTGLPVIALGGMTRRKADTLPIAYGWAAIDGLS